MTATFCTGFMVRRLCIRPIRRTAMPFTASRDPPRTLKDMDPRALVESKPFAETVGIRDLLIRPAWHAQAARRGTHVDV